MKQRSSGADPENSERRGRVPHSPPGMKTSLQPDCIIITTTRKTVRRVGAVQKRFENTRKKGGRGPLGSTLNPPMKITTSGELETFSQCSFLCPQSNLRNTTQERSLD